MNHNRSDRTESKKLRSVGTTRKKAITALKFTISAALIYFIYTKINLNDVLVVLKRASPFYLFLATVLFVVSKAFAALRLNLYFHELKVPLTHKSNFKLYLLGMFYNLFLPGGIGGDAYKGYLIKKKFHLKIKKVISVLVLDRLSGLLLLFIYACLIAILLKVKQLQGYELAFIAAIGISLLTFWLLNKKFFSNVLPVFWKSLGYSSLVQATQLVSVFFILKALSVKIYTLAYLFIFLISSIVSVLPITIGGIGSREITFLYGATWFGLNENTSIGISTIFFLITAFVSLVGVYFHFRKPKLELREIQ